MTVYTHSAGNGGKKTRLTKYLGIKMQRALVSSPGQAADTCMLGMHCFILTEPFHT